VARLSNPQYPDDRKGEAGPISCRLATPAEAQAASAVILGSIEQPASPSQVAEFFNLAAKRHIDLSQIWVARAPAGLVWAALPVVNPGKTMLLFTPAQERQPPPIGATVLLSKLCTHYSDRGVHWAQVLIEPVHSAARRFFAHHGFSEIAELIYLQGHAHRSSKPAKLAAAMHWQTYGPDTHGLFAQTILQSYRDSLDCPRLSGLRHIEDIIAGHKATGEFDPALWRLLCENGQPRGVLLLSRIVMTDALELVYLGLPPEARGRGLGNLLMQEAMHLILRDNRRRLTLAVDSLNVPALRLYYGHGMQRLASKIAMIRDLRRRG
jgi:ribosomal protein S18 acetylase RimI-like enzyme